MIGSNVPFWSALLRFVAQELWTQAKDSRDSHITYDVAHELLAVLLVGGGEGKVLTECYVVDAMKANQVYMKGMEGGNKFEGYSTAFLPDILPEHLMHSKANSSAAELLTDDDFIRRKYLPLDL